MEVSEARERVLGAETAEEAEAILAADPAVAGSRGASGASLLLEAVYRGQADTAAAIRRYLPGLDLFEAAALGDLDAALTLLAASPPRVNDVSADGWTPLHLAVFFGHPEVAERLLAAGADLAAVSRNGMAVTPLQSALACGNEDCAELLLDRGADVEGRPSTSWPPLLYTAANNLPRTARLLLERGADVNGRSPDGKTALALALEKGNGEVAAVLLSAGGVA